MANGSMVIATEKEANFGLTALIMKGIGETIRHVGKEDCFTPMAIFLKGCL